MRSKLSAPVVVLAIVFTFSGLVSAAGAYPNQLPDFAHPDAPHKDPHPAVPPFSPESGQTDFHPTGQRALLVVYVRFSDYVNQVPESRIHDRFFPIGTLRRSSISHCGLRRSREASRTTGL